MTIFVHFGSRGDFDAETAEYAERKKNQYGKPRNNTNNRMPSIPYALCDLCVKR
jgi:hypothetical protein